MMKYSLFFYKCIYRPLGAVYLSRHVTTGAEEAVINAHTVAVGGPHLWSGTVAPGPAPSDLNTEPGSTETHSCHTDMTFTFTAQL
uniref:Uncharacterized protein n=1 Tax=Knipowitschia caucasica TaxID=637954 RepID=A0AAV2LG10_KNICA